MRRLPLVFASLACVLLVAAALAPLAAAQNPLPRGGVQPMARRPPPEDNTPPLIWLIAPGGETTQEYPLIEIEWCDNTSLYADSRWIKVNGQDRTSSFSYGSGGSECELTGALSQSTSVALQMGDNTIQAHICDNYSNCTTEDWTVTRVQQGAPTVTLRNFNGDNQDRGLCLTVGAGQAAGLACGDLFVTHGMPAYRTMGRDRSLTLFYSSHQAAPRPTVAVFVSQPSGQQTPSSVFVKLTVGGVVKDSATYYAWSSANGPRQIALAYDASGDTSRLVPVSLEVRNQYSGGNYSTTIYDTLMVVNRVGSEFGAGWWLAGVEQLVLSQPGNKILWLGGDGSAAVYRSAGSYTWVRAAGAFRDTLVYNAAQQQYTRTLRHGVQVKFDNAGRHIQTVNRTGQTTTFSWSASLLTSIQVPPGVSGTTYSLAYDGSSKLDYIADPASRVLNGTVSSGNLTQLTDPDNVSVSFGYDAAHRITSRSGRRGYATAYVYGNVLHVTRVAVPLRPSTGDSSITTLEWWDEKGLAIGSPGSWQSAADTVLSRTKVDGPRTDVADTAAFRVDRWGAPVRIIGAVNDTSVVTRDATTGLVTRFGNPVGRVWGLSYDSRGNLLAQSDSTHEGHGTGGYQTATMRYTYHDGNAPDSPDSIIDPEGVVTRFRYGANGLDSLATAPNGHVTRFTYETGSLAGLLRSVVELDVPTYTDTVNWGTSTSPADQETRLFSNALGNADSVATPMGSVTRYGYNSYTQVSTVTNAVADVTQYYWRPVGVADSIAQIGSGSERRSTRFTYDDDLNRLSLTDLRRGVTRSWAYDAAGRDTSETDDYGYSERRFYGRSGLVDSVRTRATDVIRRTYDAAGRLTQIRFANRASGDAARGDTVTYTYDAGGRMLTASNRNGQIARQYYREGTLKQDSQVTVFGATLNVTLQYRYDRADRRMLYRDFGVGNDTVKIDYSYTLGALDRMIIDYPGSGAPGNDTTTYQWDALGRRQQVVTPHRATLSWYYDLDGRTRRIRSTHSCLYNCSNDSAAVDKRFKAYDRLGRALRIEQTVGQPVTTDSSAFDKYGQLSYQLHDGIRRDYGYDLSGNMTSDIQWLNGQRYGRVHVVESGHNRLLLDSLVDQSGAQRGPRYVYSVAGERLADTTSAHLGLWRDMWYDALGRMTSTGGYAVSTGVQDQDSTVWVSSYYLSNFDTCRYDALGRRVKACGGYSMAYDGDQPVRVASSRIIYGPSLDDPIAVYDSALGAGQPQLHFFLTDGAGRLLSYTDSSGYDRRGDGYNNVYTERAIFAGALANPHGFRASAGESKNVPDLSFFRNRYYDQRSGRFTQEDPIRPAGGINLYAYVGNNPVAYTDPFGLNPCLVYPTACAAVAGAVAFAGVRLVANAVEGRPLLQGVGSDAIRGAALGASVGGLVRSAVQAVTGAGEGAEVSATQHGAGRMADPSRLSEVGARWVESNPSRTFTQADGAEVLVREAGGKFNVVVRGEGGVVTTFKNLSERALQRLGRNYGWQPD